MPVTRKAQHLGLTLLLTAACDLGGGPPGTGDDLEPDDIAPRCGPARGVVAEVIDGDTIRLESGEKIRYLMVDTPEITNGKTECFGAEARDYNAELALGQEVELAYDAECSDAYGRLLAFVTAPDGEINTLMVARGYACVLMIPPNGEDRLAEFNTMVRTAEDGKLGMWGACGSDVCN